MEEEISILTNLPAVRGEQFAGAKLQPRKEDGRVPPKRETKRSPDRDSAA